MTSVMDSSLMRNDDHQIQGSSLMPTMSMYRNMMASDGHNMNNQMSYPMNINMNNMLDGRHQQSMSSDRHMSDMRMSDRQMSDRQMYRNIMMGDNMMNMQMRNMENLNLDDGLLHERNTMAQRMEVERIPENAMTYFYF